MVDDGSKDGQPRSGDRRVSDATPGAARGRGGEPGPAPDVTSEGVTAVLCSGGLDSAVLVAHETRAAVVQPVYVHGGLAWEAIEREYLERLLDTPALTGRVRPRVDLECSLTDLYAPRHWALMGTPPAYATPDEDVYLVGRNVLLLSKAAVYCALRQIHRLAVGPLAGNPFPDATPEFFAAMTRALSIGLDHELEIATPFSTWSKADVITRGTSLGVALEHTMSCMSPSVGRHCGRCSKCRERLQAFAAAGVEDPADYAFRPLNVQTGA